MKMRKTLMAAAVMAAMSGSAAAFQPVGGLWDNPAKNGQGYDLVVQRETLVVTFFVYDSLGEPEWYQAAGPMKNLDGSPTFTAQVNRFNGGPPSPDVEGSGTLTITFDLPGVAGMEWRGERQEIRLRDFGFGTGPEAMYGVWNYAWSTSSRTYVFGQKGPSVIDGGTGVFGSMDGRAAGECNPVGSCILVGVDRAGDLIDAFMFLRTTGTAVGFHETSSGTRAGMSGFFIAPLTAIGRSLNAGHAAADALSQYSFDE